MSTTPYTTSTGLRIGCMYQPTTKPEHDRHALKLQSALINKADPMDTDGITIALVAGVLIACAVVLRWLGVLS
jgi:hypothetical protein